MRFVIVRCAALRCVALRLCVGAFVLSLSNSFFLPLCFPCFSQNRFGDSLGERVWESCNAVFDRLPLAGIIDHDIFCVHGGIPRPLPDSTSYVQVRDIPRSGLHTVGQMFFC